MTNFDKLLIADTNFGNAWNGWSNIISLILVASQKIIESMKGLEK